MFLKKYFLYLILITGLLACNKAEQRDKILQGSWTLKKVTVFDYDGLSYSSDTSCVGELVLNRELDTSFLFHFSYSIYPAFSDSTFTKGRYLLKDDAEYFSHEILTTTNPSPVPGNHSRILFLSNEFFKWEYITPSGIRYHLIFQKQ